jgi:DNA-binding NarL/FixJ family response regulator
MTLSEAVGACLRPDAKGGGIEAALTLLARELNVARVSLHAVDPASGAFRVIGGGGDEILAPGTELPLETSTQVRVPAGGDVFRRLSFAEDESFDRSLDQLVCEMGFRSGCSVPLFIGSRPAGALCISSRDAHLDCDPLIDALNDVSAEITLALHAARSGGAARIVVCFDDLLVAEGIARVIEHALAAEIQICATREEAIERCAPDAWSTGTLVCDSAFGGERLDRFLTSLRSAGYGGPAMVVASNDSPLHRTLAERSRVAGYVPRSAGQAAIVAAIRNLVAGRPSGVEPSGDGDGPQLTPQESKVLLALERGLRFKQIALELAITESTAKGYARNLFAKLNAHSRAEAVYQARRQGVLELARDPSV